MRKIIIILLFIAFWFKGNTLYWTTEEGKKPAINFLQFQLDHKNPPTINQKDIKTITITKDKVFVNTEDKYWILHYSDNLMIDWYVEDWRKL